jgi:hypothetical protein
VPLAAAVNIHLSDAGVVALLIGKESGCPDRMREKSGSGPLGPIFSGVWQSLQPPTVTRYLPRSTRVCWRSVDFARVHAAVPSDAIAAPATKIRRTMFLDMMVLQHSMCSAERPGRPSRRPLDRAIGAADR